MSSKRARGRQQSAKTSGRGKRKRAGFETYQNGPLQISRHGKIVVFRNNSTPEQQEKLQEFLATRHIDVCREITEKVAVCKALVHSHNPLHTLTRCYWYFLYENLGRGPEESSITSTQTRSLRLIEYVQMLVAAAPNPFPAQEISEEDFRILSRTVGDLYEQLLSEHSITATAFARKQPGYDEGLDEFQTLAQMHWLAVRGDRYLSQDEPFLSTYLAPHSEILRTTYGVDGQGIANGAGKLIRSITNGLADAVQDLHEFRDDTLPELERLFSQESSSDVDPLELMDRVCKEHGWEQRREDVRGRFFGTDLFDVSKLTGWPDAFIDAMSVAAGSEPAIDEGEHASWPIKFSLTRVTPFLKIEGKSYFFNIHGVTDHLYRATQRALRRDAPGYDEGWNVAQKNATETNAMALLCKLLPKATAYGPAHYQLPREDGSKSWTECDGLVLFDRHLFIVEAKAGAYTPASPSEYIEGHIQRLKSLVVDAVKQAARFNDLLESQTSVEIYDHNHSWLASLKRSDFDRVVLCCLSLDQLEHITSHVEDLTDIGLEVGRHPLWCLSLDDLEVYVDVFDNPLILLSYLEERFRAAQSKVCRVMDELDHLGLYLQHNRYVTYAEGIGVDLARGWHGYRDELDRYYSAKWDNKPTKPPLQKMPRRMRQIVDTIAHSRSEKRFQAAEALLCMDEDTRNAFSKSVDDLIELQRRMGRPRPLTTVGEVRLTLFVNQRGVAETRLDDCIEHTLAVMHMQAEETRTLLQIQVSEYGLIEKVDWRILNAEDLAAADKAAIAVRCQKIDLTRNTFSTKSMGEKFLKS
jgi:hypothetical protein